MADIIQKTKNESKNIAEFKTQLLQQDIECYSRNGGELTGIIYNNRKYRFKTVGMSKEELNELDKGNAKEKPVKKSFDKGKSAPTQEDRLARFHKELDKHNKKKRKKNKEKMEEEQSLPDGTSYEHKFIEKPLDQSKDKKEKVIEKEASIEKSAEKEETKRTYKLGVSKEQTSKDEPASIPKEKTEEQQKLQDLSDLRKEQEQQKENDRDLEL